MRDRPAQQTPPREGINRLNATAPNRHRLDAIMSPKTFHKNAAWRFVETKHAIKTPLKSVSLRVVVLYKILKTNFLYAITSAVHVRIRNSLESMHSMCCISAFDSIG